MFLVRHVPGENTTYEGEHAMKIVLPTQKIRDKGIVKFGGGNIQDLRISLPPKSVADKGVVKFGGGNIQDMRTA
jgi:hypothetical protein